MERFRGNFGARKGQSRFRGTEGAKGQTHAAAASWSLESGEFPSCSRNSPRAFDFFSVCDRSATTGSRHQPTLQPHRGVWRVECFHLVAANSPRAFDFFSVWDRDDGKPAPTHPAAASYIKRRWKMHIYMDDGPSEEEGKQSSSCFLYECHLHLFSCKNMNGSCDIEARDAERLSLEPLDVVLECFSLLLPNSEKGGRGARLRPSAEEVVPKGLLQLVEGRDGTCREGFEPGPSSFLQGGREGPAFGRIRCSMEHHMRLKPMDVIRGVRGAIVWRDGGQRELGRDPSL
ncbi:hypothetical protein Taro_042909 [Colocasia esculenta]|uniref:Uncharacterized protein n=1 Tax=Colocasia esculenta TaxID=4460 RepID=A0A843WXQ1_COLES|nr:hypothetical protein [Colocasia esculenta]